jgi:CheY-like chemotaxis protein
MQAEVDARDGEEALALFSEQPVDAAIIEVALPKMNGVDLCGEMVKRAKAQNRDLPVWLIAAAWPDQMAQSAAAAGARELLRKPVEFGELHEKLKKELDLSEAAQPSPAEPEPPSGPSLELEVSEPAEKNGAGIFVAAGNVTPGDQQETTLHEVQGLVARGYTVFSVLHGPNSAPTLLEKEQDVHRAIRFVRHHAGQWNVDPDKLGILGLADGALALLIATRGRPGDSTAPDPVDRQSSVVQAAACILPPNNLAKYWKFSGDDDEEESSARNRSSFWLKVVSHEGAATAPTEPSPTYLVTAKTPPLLLIHGDAGTRAEVAAAAREFKNVGPTLAIIIKPAAVREDAEGEKDFRACADWFDEHLTGRVR